MAAFHSSTQTGTPAGEEPWAVVVKNTFITIAEAEEEVSQVRAASLPPSFRASGGCELSPRGRRVRPLASKAPSEEDESTEAESQTGEDDHSTAASTLAEEEQQSLEGLELGPQQKTETAEQVFSPPAAPAGARRLRSTAAAWTPSPALMAGPSEEGRRFRLQLERVVQAARSILLGLACISSVEATCAVCGWTVGAKIRKDDFHCKEMVLTKAKEAFLMAAEASESVYLLGYAARPFVSTPVGFSARFASVQNSHKACWGMLQTGFCQFGNNCHWQHPEHQATVSVLAMLETDQ